VGSEQELVRRVRRGLTRLRKKARACPEPNVSKTMRASVGGMAALEDNFGAPGKVSLVHIADSPFPWA